MSSAAFRNVHAWPGMPPAASTGLPDRALDFAQNLQQLVSKD